VNAKKNKHGLIDEPLSRLCWCATTTTTTTTTLDSNKEDLIKKIFQQSIFRFFFFQTRPKTDSLKEGAHSHPSSLKERAKSTLVLKRTPTPLV